MRALLPVVVALLLALAGISAETPDPPGGHIYHDDDGELLISRDHVIKAHQEIEFG